MIQEVDLNWMVCLDGSSKLKKKRIDIINVYALDITSNRIYLIFLVAPTVTVPNQLLGAPLGTEVTLKCYVEAFPNTINYWVKNRRGTNEDMLLEG